jgi:glycosyltransferase involved in cell wall biosynthesis
MRVAVISGGLPARGQKRGGIERVAHVLAQGLAGRGHAVVVFSHDPRPDAASYEVRDLPWRRFVGTWLGRRVTMGYLGNILSVLPDYHEFDAIIAHGDSLLLPVTNKPFVRVMMGSALGEALHATSMGRFFLQCGVYVQELLTAAIAPRSVVGISDNTRRYNPFVRHVIPLGVDTAIFQPRRDQKTAHPSILFVGAVDGRKRGRFLLDVFLRVIRPAIPETELMFVGAQGPSMAGVTYYTGIPDEQLAALYRRAWVYASPSSYEGFGLPYLEAMACGTAVVATPNPGSREVLGEQYSGLVADAAFGAAIVDILRDREQRLALEVSGIARASDFSSERMINQYEALLLRLTTTHA